MDILQSKLDLEKCKVIKKIVSAYKHTHIHLYGWNSPSTIT